MRVEADEGIEFVARNETGAGVVCEGGTLPAGPAGRERRRKVWKRPWGKGVHVSSGRGAFGRRRCSHIRRRCAWNSRRCTMLRRGIGGGQLGYTCSSCSSTVGVRPISRKSSMRAWAPRRVISAAHTKRGVSTNARALSTWRRKECALDEARGSNFLTRIEMRRPCVVLRPTGSPPSISRFRRESRRGASLSWHIPSWRAFMPILMQKAGLRPPELRPSDGGLSSILCRRALRVGMRRRPRRGPAFPRLQPLHRYGACRCPRCWWIRRLPRRCWPC